MTADVLECIFVGLAFMPFFLYYVIKTYRMVNSEHIGVNILYLEEGVEDNE